MEIGMPFDFDSSAAEPAEYNATIQRMVNAAMITNGIYPQVRIVDDNILDPSAYVGQSLLVSPAEGTLGVVISKGMAQVEGTTYINTADKAITIPTDNISRTYDIVVELDLINGTLTVKSRQRENEETLADRLTRTDTMYQLALATVTIPANATSVLPAYITDHRLNTDIASDGKPICGLVGSAMQADTRMISEVLYQALEEEVVTNLVLQVEEAKAAADEAYAAATEAQYVTGIMTANGTMELGWQPSCVIVFATTLTSIANESIKEISRNIAFAFPLYPQRLSTSTDLTLEVMPAGFKTDMYEGLKYSTGISAAKPLRYIAFK